MCGVILRFPYDSINCIRFKGYALSSANIFRYQNTPKRFEIIGYQHKAGDLGAFVARKAVPRPLMLPKGWKSGTAFRSTFVPPYVGSQIIFSSIGEKLQLLFLAVKPSYQCWWPIFFSGNRFEIVDIIVFPRNKMVLWFTNQADSGYTPLIGDCLIIVFNWLQKRENDLSNPLKSFIHKK